MAQPEEATHNHLYHKICRLKQSVTARIWNQIHPVKDNIREEIWDTGTLVKVVMVSRFGDCGITTELNVERGYHARVMPEQLEIV